MTENKKKKYVRPLVQVFELKQRPQLLQMSNPDYVPGGDPLNP